MAATLAPTSPETLVLALDQLTPGSVAHTLVLDALPVGYVEEYWDRISWDALIADVQRAEYAAERYLEDRGYDEARGQEDHEARFGIPAGGW